MNMLSDKNPTALHRRRKAARLIRRAKLVLMMLTLLAWPLWPVAAAAQSVAQSREYDQCIELAMREPEAAFERAIAWRDLGGGVAARHCVAVALYGLGQFRESALRLERLVQDKVNTGLQISLLSQAGNAWLMAEEYERAHAVLSAGLELAPDHPDLLIDRSLVYAAAENYWETVDDLNRALDIDPDNADALVFRASAYRYLDSLDLAADDVNRALSFKPAHVAAYLERGIIRRLSNNPNGAREDWLHTIKLAPDSPAAEAARRNLEMLDIKAQ
jgi:tetratricopeptide (TPR) repeat protein